MHNRETTAMFIGHRECWGLDKDRLEEEIIRLIEHGVTTFLSGGMGQFDAVCEHIVSRLQKTYPRIKLYIIMPYPNFKPSHIFDPKTLTFPDGFEKYHPKAAIVKRNRYMVDCSLYALCYVRYSWGGAAQTLQYAKKQSLRCIQLTYEQG